MKKILIILVIVLIVLGLISCQNEEMIPFGETKYYRIKVVNTDGSVEYSNIISHSRR